MAIVMGGMFAAIDSTAGERERGSLSLDDESDFWLAASLGKTAAVMSVSVLIVLLTVSSFFPGTGRDRQRGIKS